MPTIRVSGLSSFRARLLQGVAFTVVSFLLAGCGLGPGAGPVSPEIVTFNGSIHGGQQPVSGAHVALFATSSSGYGGTVTPLATTTSDQSGGFRITSSYTCPADQQAYIVSTGGNPGLSSTTDNSAIFLVAALGPCPAVSASTFVIINEVTTVAAAYALSGFLPAGGAGITEAAVVAGTAMPGVTTSSTNVRGLTDAFSNAANVVNYSSGMAYATTPTTAANGTVPQATINALADILQTCVNTSSPSGCTSLFSAATPPAGTGVAAPVNSFQAALNIARYPANNVGALYMQLSSTPAFPTTLTAAPNDWTLGITYTAALLSSGAGMGIDANDNVYVTGKPYLINFSSRGEPLTTATLAPSVATTDTLRQIAFDLYGNLFISDDSQTGVYKYTPSSSTATFLSYNAAPATTSTPTASTDPNTYSIAVDGLGDAFTTSYSKSSCSTVGCNLFEFPASGTTTPSQYAPYSLFSGSPVAQPAGAIGGARGIAFDVKTGNLWITAIDDNLGEVVTLTPSASGVASAGAVTQLSSFGTEAGTPSSNTAYGTISVAVDSTSRAWYVVMGGPAVTGSKATNAVPGALYPVSSAGVIGTAVTGGGLNTPTTVAVDGNNNLFIANGSGSAAASSVVEYSPALGAFLSGTAGFIPSSTGVLYEPAYLAIDRSGALWVLSSGSGSATKPANLIQVLGVAAPTNPILAAGQYGAKP